MAKTLAQGRKPGSGRKPGKGKTLREGRKPGSGRRRKNFDEQDSSVRNTGKMISSRDLEAVDALRGLNGNPEQQQLQQLQQQSGMANTRTPTPTPTPTPTHILPDLRSPHFLAHITAPEPPIGASRLPLTQSRLLSNTTGGSTGSFSLHDMNPHSITPQFMHSPPAVASSLMVPIGNSGSSVGSSSDNASNSFQDTKVTNRDDPAGSVLIHTSI